MSYIADDWSLGTLPLQHLDYKTEKQLPLDFRHVVYGCRMGRRKIDDGDLGHYVVAVSYTHQTLTTTPYV